MTDFLEQYRIDDEILNTAYYSAEPGFRALLKTAVSLSYHYFGHESAITNIKKVSQDLNIIQDYTSKPVNRPIIFFDAVYNAPGRLCCSALMPILAGSPPPLAICLGDKPHPDLLLALEIAGTEDIFCMSSNIAAEYLRDFSIKKNNKNIEDTVLVFLNGKFNYNLVAEARHAGLKFYEEKYLPEIISVFPDKKADKLKNSYDLQKMLANIKFAQGITPEVFIYNKDMPDFKDKYYDCIYVPDNEIPAGHLKNCRLMLSFGCEAFWLFPDYSPDFFCRHRLALGFVNNEFQRMS